MGKKTSYLLNKKMKRKNQIFKYHAPSSEGYNEEDTRSINKKPPNPGDTEEENQKIYEMWLVKSFLT